MFSKRTNVNHAALPPFDVWIESIVDVKIASGECRRVQLDRQSAVDESIDVNVNQTRSDSKGILIKQGSIWEKTGISNTRTSKKKTGTSKRGHRKNGNIENGNIENNIENGDIEKVVGNFL
jgi:hypothetical protein